MPARISIPPTAYMKSCALPGISSSTQPARYLGQSVRTLKNLSRPNAIGAIVNATRSIRKAWSPPPRAAGAAADTDGQTRRALSAAAERLGHEIAEEADPAAELESLLVERGYEPFHDEQDVVRMRNCPFHAVAQRHPEIVCEMNLA